VSCVKGETVQELWKEASDGVAEDVEVLVDGNNINTSYVPLQSFHPNNRPIAAITTLIQVNTSLNTLTGSFEFSFLR